MILVILVLTRVVRYRYAYFIINTTAKANDTTDILQTFR